MTRLIEDILVALYLFIPRIGLPILVLVGAGYVASRIAGAPERVFVSPRRALAILGLGLLWMVGAGVTVARFVWGLGAVTALSDRFPWGLWIGFDVLCGVALAAGGFVIAGAVYVFNLQKYHPVVRPAVLTAFLGYLLVVAALLFDLGRPYRIWHPIIYWQHHSVMFEVAWCVTLYTSVLALEFSPLVLERFRLTWALRIVKAVTVPLVIAGVVLSTLHQSSLGSLYLIVPEKLYPLWYSPLLPVFFFVSAIAAGLAMVIVESNISSRAFKRSLESDILADLGKGAAWVLALYAVLKFGDLLARGAWPLLLVANAQSALFWIEMNLGVVLPAGLLATRRVREDPSRLFRAACLVVGGVVLNRLNVSLVGMLFYTGPVYVPSWMEIVVTLTLISLGVVAFGLAAKYLPVFEEGRGHAEGSVAPV